MRKLVKISLTLMVITFDLLLFSICAFAANMPSTKNVVEVKNVQQYRSPRKARVTANPRGRLISSAEVTLTDKGNGTIGIYADLLCHEPMKSLRMWLYLEKWIPEDEDWVTETYEQFEWMAEDYPNEDLTMAVVSYDIPKLERGQDYRIRGIFGADALTSTLGETWTINTPNFFLE